jgi:hypothetical protein
MWGLTTILKNLQDLDTMWLKGGFGGTQNDISSLDGFYFNSE